MLKRIILVVAIIAGLAVAGLNFTIIQQKIQALTTDRNNQRSAKEQAQTQLAKTKKELVATQNELSQTKQDLANAESAEHQAEHKLADAIAQMQDLNTKLAKASQDRDDAQNQLAAYKNTGLTPEQIIALDKNLKDAETGLEVANQEKAILTHEVAKLTSQIKELTEPGYVVALPPNLKGTVMAVDPKWHFVVLNIGANQGVLDDAEMLVSRDGRLVGKVVVRSVQKDRCIANLVPGWELGDVIEGDVVIPAHPATS
jgi:hypothetical protein